MASSFNSSSIFPPSKSNHGGHFRSEAKSAHVLPAVLPLARTAQNFRTQKRAACTGGRIIAQTLHAGVPLRSGSVMQIRHHDYTAIGRKAEKLNLPVAFWLPPSLLSHRTRPAISLPADTVTAGH